MSISSAMSNAVLGLRAAGRGAEVVSSNISNALTPGYGRRELVLTSGSFGGVREAGVVRLVDAGLASDRRLSEASNSNAQAQLDFHLRVESLLGTPGSAGSLSARLASFEGSLITAASRPDAPERLEMVVSEASDLAQTLGNASDGIQAARSQADQSINAQVKTLNASLAQAQKLNVEIQTTRTRGGDTSALMDQRQKVIDTIGAIVPLRELARDGGQVALYSTGGAALLDGRASTVGFTPANSVTAYMSISSGTLSGLTINDQPVRTDSENGALRGGSLGAQFAIRDELGIAAQTEIDAFARDLVGRFADPAVDTTLAPGDAGLFTDTGLAFNPADEVGLSSRLTVNAAIDPAQGGDAWRIRDGMNALTEGPVGDATLIQNLSNALTGARATVSGGFAGSTLSAAGLVSAMISDVGATVIGAEQEVSFTSARLTVLTQEQLAQGVDTDQELQNLLLVEQSYAANARLLEVLDELMQILNRL